MGSWLMVDGTILVHGDAWHRWKVEGGRQQGQAQFTSVMVVLLTKRKERARGSPDVA